MNISKEKGVNYDYFTMSTRSTIRSNRCSFERRTSMNAQALAPIKHAIGTATKFASKNSPVILAGIAIVGVIGTAFTAVRAREDARVIEEEMHREAYSADGEHHPLETTDVIKRTWKCYIPCAAVMVTTVACIIGGTAVSIRRLAVVAGLYELSDAKLAKYKEQVASIFGEDGEKEVTKKVEDFVPRDELVADSDGYIWCIDSFGVRWRTKENILLASQNQINYEINCGGCPTLNDWYEINSLDATAAGELFSWDVDHMLDLDFDNAKMVDSRPMLYINYRFQRPTW